MRDLPTCKCFVTNYHSLRSYRYSKNYTFTIFHKPRSVEETSPPTSLENTTSASEKLLKLFIHTLMPTLIKTILRS